MPIPDDLRDAMRQVHELLGHAEDDPGIAVDFDDAIQVGGLCGGRYREGKRPFGFTYFPPDRDERGRWLLTLHPQEIEDIADGVMTEIKLYSCTSPDCRMKFREADDTCFYCDYYDDAGATPNSEELLKSLQEKVRRRRRGGS